jgi:predicted permease
VTGGSDAERVSAMWVTRGLIELIGARPIMGRVFGADEFERGRANFAILSHQFFLRRFGGDASIIGRTIHIDDEAHTIVGVMAPETRFSLRTGVVDLWTPLPLVNDPHWGGLTTLARLRPGVSIAAAQSALSAAAQHVNDTQHPYNGPNGEDAGYRVKVVSLREELFGQFRFATLLLLGAVAAVLLIACVNVANLLMVRAVAREKETAVRRALGASTTRLVRQWITEAGVIALLGGIAGVIAAIWAVRLLSMASPISLPSVAILGVDTRALLFTLLVTAIVCVVFGLAPAAAARPIQLRGAPARRRVAPFLVTIEVALSVLLLIGAGLLLKSFARLSSVDAGFNPDHLLTMQIQRPPSRGTDGLRNAAFFAEVSQRLQVLPGVTSASTVGRLPVAGGQNTRGGDPFSIEGRPYQANGPTPQIAHSQSIGLDYFRTLQIPVQSGRVFTASDNLDAPRAAIVNETLARGFFPKGDAIGHRIVLGAPGPKAHWMTIVGIVGDVKTAALDQTALPQIYTPHAQNPSPAMAIVLRLFGWSIPISPSTTSKPWISVSPKVSASHVSKPSWSPCLPAPRCFSPRSESSEWSRTPPRSAPVKSASAWPSAPIIRASCAACWPTD